MKNGKYRIVLYAIALVILAVIAIQVYWNINNYQNNKRQLINDVQVSLDNAVDTYYDELAEKNTFGFAFDEGEGTNFVLDGRLDSITSTIARFQKNPGTIGSIDFKKNDTYKVLKGKSIDSLMEIGPEISKGIKLSKKKYNLAGDEIGSTSFTFKDLDSLPEKDAARFLGINKGQGNKVSSLKISESDSILDNNLKFLTSKIVISITTDSIPLRELDTILRSELSRKAIDIDYGLKFMEKDSSLSFLNKEIVETSLLKTQSKSTFLPKKTLLSIYFKNTTKEVLLRSLTGIAISLLLVLAVISTLFYLLKVIKDQKQLAEMKNDLISNITHEFKTPIATVGVALEGMRDFKVLEDTEKTMKYIGLSEIQLSKLNTMVEKLLETASLDSETLNLNKETINLIEMVEGIVANHKIQLQSKSFSFNKPSVDILINVDAFHFENAISNLLDNALKYGGDEILIDISPQNGKTKILVIDDGKQLKKEELNKIFDKFYRVQKGNQHDVKGFGIGLYYTKTIIEKHGGSLNVRLDSKGTIFKIEIPNG